jgi:hypothetical protein
MIDIDLKIKGLSFVESLANQSQIDKAITRALNRSMSAAFTAGSKKIREDYTLKAGDIKKSAKIIKATYSKSVVTLRITGRPIPFKYFNPKQTGRGVTIKIRKDKPRQLIKHAFIGGYIPVTKSRRGGYAMKRVNSYCNGNVFIRKGKKRLPIIMMKTSSVTMPKLFASKKVMPVLEVKANEVFKKAFWDNYKYFLDKSR